MRIITPDDAAFLPSPSNPPKQIGDLVFETTVVGDVVGVYASLTQANSSNSLACPYIISLYAENTTTMATGSLTQTVRYSLNGGLNTIGNVIALDVIPNGGSFNDFITIDNATDIEWKYDVAGWTAGSADVRLRVMVYRLG